MTTAEVKSGARSFRLTVTSMAGKYLGQVWDEQRQRYGFSVADADTEEEAKRDTEEALRAYLAAQGIDCPELELHWIEST